MDENNSLRKKIVKYSSIPIVLSFIKWKILKLFLKLTIVGSILWFIADTWLGKKFNPLAKYVIGKDLINFTLISIHYVKMFAAGSLFIILGSFIFSYKVWKGFYWITGIGLIVSFIERFIL